MSNKKQSSIDLLLYYLPLSIEGQFKEQIEQVKAIHKEEILDAYERGMEDGYYFEGSQSDWEAEGNTKYFGERHYNETFNK